MVGGPAPPGLTPLGGQQETDGPTPRRNPARPPSGPGAPRRTLEERLATRVANPHIPTPPPIDLRETQTDEREAERLILDVLGGVVTEDWRLNKDRTALVDQISRQVHKIAPVL